ncbi:hypothetical protein EV424DRAFT_1347109 [Suillus variegatus]|nr:hypothetical protein EV424DRAFT_1347109 [Suillus variegatus]
MRPRSSYRYFRGISSHGKTTQASLFPTSPGHQAVLDAQPTPKPPHDFTITKIREQSFGAAEWHQTCVREPGKTLEAHFTEGKYPILYESEKRVAFPGGESAEDLTRRGEKAVRDVVLPHVVNVARSGMDEHITLMPLQVADDEVPAIDMTVTDEGRADHLEGLLTLCHEAIMGGGVVDAKIWSPNLADITQTSIAPLLLSGIPVTT